LDSWDHPWGSGSFWPRQPVMNRVARSSRWHLGLNHPTSNCPHCQNREKKKKLMEIWHQGDQRAAFKRETMHEVVSYAQTLCLGANWSKPNIG
jgi:ribosomal protein L37AE/L43A